MTSQAIEIVKAPRLFGAKTRIPLPPPHFLSRPRLLDALRTGLSRKLTLLIAPAGFGKTTLVAELARALGPAAAWLTLDPGDGDLSIFMHYLVAAVAQVRPGFGAETRAWLAATPVAANQVADLAAIFLGELEEVCGPQLVLFLDDFHEVGASESITRLLDFLLRYLPPPIQMVISTRTPPGLNTTQLVVRQQAIGLGTTDLRFRLDEARTWFAARPEAPDPAQIAHLVEVCEGWVTGMILQSVAAIWPPQPGVPAAQLYRYLSTEVLERQPPELRSFLLRASVLNHWTIPLCNAVLEIGNTAALLQQIQEQQLFLVVESEGASFSYRLHQLFREFLADQLRMQQPEEFARLHQRAAAYFEQQGDFGPAMEHLFAIPDWDRAAALTTGVGNREIGAGRWERVATWIAHFPVAEPANRSALLLLEAWLLATQGQYAAAGDVLARAEQALAVGGDQRGIAEALALRARLAVARGDGRQILDLARRALAIPAAAPTTHALAQNLAGIAYSICGDAAGSDAAFAAARAAYLGLHDIQGAAGVASDWGRALLLREELSRATEQLETALDYAYQAGNRRLQARALSNLAAVHQARGESALAHEQLATALDLARRLHWHRVEAEILLDQAENALDLHGPQVALPLYEEASQVAGPIAPATLVAARAGQARCQRLAGRYIEAARLARLGLEAAQADELPFETALCRLELGASLLVHSPEAALPLLQEAEQMLIIVGRKRDAARATALLATALFAQSDYAAAEAVMDRAYTAAEAGGSSLFLASELATIYGLPLLRRAGGSGSRYAGLFAAVTRYLETETRAAKEGRSSTGAALHLVRERPRVLEIYSLGQANVYRDGILLARGEWQTTTAKELFFHLVEYPEGQRKDTILAALWPDQSYTRANDNFHTSIRRLRTALGMEMVKVENNIYRINPALSLWHDGTEALTLIERAHQESDHAQTRRLLTAAAELLKGPFAEEFYRDWAGARRQFWETQSKEVLSWLADDALRQGAFDAAVAWGQRLLALDPLDEGVHTLLMRIYGAAGRPALLVQQYNELSRALRYELDDRPSPETDALYQRLLRTTAP